MTATVTDLHPDTRTVRIGRRPAKGSDPAPNVILHGLPLYRCAPLSALISVKRCRDNRRIATEWSERESKKWTPSLYRRKRTPTKGRLSLDQWTDAAAILKERMESCIGCAGVLALRRRELQGLER